MAALPPSLESSIREMREQIRRSEGRGGQCGFVAEWIATTYLWAAHSGVYLSPSGEPIGDHVWNVLPDGAILDATADQFCEGYDVRIISPADPEHSRFRPEWTADYNPGLANRYPELAGVSWSGEFDFDVARRLREMRGDGWWLPDPSQLREWNAETAYATAFQGNVSVPRH
jgi:hypothetical protein